MKYSLVLAAATAISGAVAAVPRWGQCGGNGYSGDTACSPGDFCSTLNPWYAQCLQGAGGATTTAKTTTTSSRAPVVTTTTTRSTTNSPTFVNPTTTRSTTTPAGPTRTSSTTTPAVIVTTPKPTATTTKGPVGPVGPTITLGGNPFSGRRQNPNSYYSSEVYTLAIPSLVAGGKASLTAAAKAVATVPNFIWFDTISKVPALDGYLADIRAKNAAGDNIIGTFVVYDLPDRDCAAKASNGELSIAANGATRYKTEYIDGLAAIFKKYPDVPVALILEPDSVANMITNMGVPKCSNAKTTYEDCITYAAKTLNMPNIAMYMDAGHAGWLGWPENLKKAGPYYAGLYKTAGSPKSLRGLATNVANYNAWSVSTCPSYTSDFARITGYCDEKGYINALAPLLHENGFPAQFVVDQGRSGKQPTGQVAWGDWCNIKGTGFGIRPDTPSPDPLLDAFVWIKPGGECDGTSDQSASRYDSTCGLPAALTPAPEAGTWFQAYFEQLLVNANPKF